MPTVEKSEVEQCVHTCFPRCCENKGLVIVTGCTFFTCVFIHIFAEWNICGSSSFRVNVQNAVHESFMHCPSHTPLPKHACPILSMFSTVFI